VNEPTPEEAAAALRAVHEGRDQVIRSAVGGRWLSIIGGVIVFLYCVSIDLFPAAQPWITWVLVAVMLALVFGLRTRVGGTLLGRSVGVSGRTMPVSAKWRLLRMSPILGIAIAAALIIQLFHVPHGVIYYGALAGLYVIFLGPRFQLWLLRHQDRG
jgi:hypothetical protein